MSIIYPLSSTTDSSDEFPQRDPYRDPPIPLLLGTFTPIDLSLSLNYYGGSLDETPALTENTLSMSLSIRGPFHTIRTEISNMNYHVTVQDVINHIHQQLWVGVSPALIESWAIPHQTITEAQHAREWRIQPNIYSGEILPSYDPLRLIDFFKGFTYFCGLIPTWPDGIDGEIVWVVHLQRHSTCAAQDPTLQELLYRSSGTKDLIVDIPKLNRIYHHLHNSSGVPRAVFQGCNCTHVQATPTHFTPPQYHGPSTSPAYPAYPIYNNMISPYNPSYSHGPFSPAWYSSQATTSPTYVNDTLSPALPEYPKTFDDPQGPSKGHGLLSRIMRRIRPPRNSD